MNAIKFKNFKVIGLLLEFISQSDLSISKITQKELSLLIQTGCQNLIEFLDKTVVEMESEDPRAELENGDSVSYLFQRID